jgi:hypothetical protein
MSSSLVDEALIPVDVQVDDSTIHVRFQSGLEIRTPVARFPRLRDAKPEARVRWQLNGRGYGIHWPDADEDITVRGLFAGALPQPESAVEQIPALVGDLLRTTRKLNSLFEGRPFTPDGHLVGSIGEVVAEYIYEIKLAPCSTPHIDAYTDDGSSVQIKLTGEKGTSFGIRWSSLQTEGTADFLICLKLTAKGFVEIYNGKFPVDLLLGRKDSSNGQLGVTVNKLTAINPSLLPKKNSFDRINRWFTPDLADVA